MNEAKIRTISTTVDIETYEWFKKHGIPFSVALRDYRRMREDLSEIKNAIAMIVSAIEDLKSQIKSLEKRIELLELKINMKGGNTNEKK